MTSGAPQGIPTRRLGGLLILVIIVAGFFAYQRFSQAGAKTSKSAYHAVFLANNQVYFGKVNNLGGQYVRLTDVYYLQASRPLQPIPAEEVKKDEVKKEGETTAGEEQKPQFSLIKLGQELHGPTDEMIINRDQVLFVEELQRDSKVRQAIEKNKAERK